MKFYLEARTKTMAKEHLEDIIREVYATRAPYNYNLSEDDRPFEAADAIMKEMTEE